MDRGLVDRQPAATPLQNSLQSTPDKTEIRYTPISRGFPGYSPTFALRMTSMQHVSHPGAINRPGQGGAGVGVNFIREAG